MWPQRSSCTSIWSREKESQSSGLGFLFLVEGEVKPNSKGCMDLTDSPKVLPFSADKPECMKATEVSDCISKCADNLWKGCVREKAKSRLRLTCCDGLLFWGMSGLFAFSNSALQAYGSQWFTLLCNFVLFLGLLFYVLNWEAKVCNGTPGRHLCWLMAAKCLV